LTGGSEMGVVRPGEKVQPKSTKDNEAHLVGRGERGKKE